MLLLLMMMLMLMIVVVVVVAVVVVVDDDVIDYADIVVFLLFSVNFVSRIVCYLHCLFV